MPLRKAASMFHTSSSSRSSKSRKASDIACIFVHVGAGFHSRENEANHLQACNDACKAGMALMRAGGSAVDAVEIAIKVLEDREITNAGFGSNLGFDGVVECDAIVVDHLGRSGGVGAVTQIKNPISLARLLLDHSTKQLSLRRVPPNLLVAQGATQFADEHKMPLATYDDLISPFARHRWQKWRSDLIKHERHRQREEAKRYGLSPPPSSEIEHEHQSDPDDSRFDNTRQVHEKAMTKSLRNEGQPISPRPSPAAESPSAASQPDSPWSIPEAEESGNSSPERLKNVYTDPNPVLPESSHKMAHHPFANSTQTLTPNTSFSQGPSYRNNNSGERYFDEDMVMGDMDDVPLMLQRPRRAVASHDGSYVSESDDTTTECRNPIASRNSSLATSTTSASPTLRPLAAPPAEEQHAPLAPRVPAPVNPFEDVPEKSLPGPSQLDGEDHITDTVGAIAIDVYGNIACGASSGGIGMKHRGRVGPAALVGIGAAVLPVDPEDKEQTAIATVTSGTGEHMGTTLAARVCSERIQDNIRKVRGGWADCVEDEALRGFIDKDFMGHPSVRESESAGAIGVLSVKKTKDGVWLYFGHNTNSFALASMHSDEARPVCTMSRSNSNGSVAQGGRAIRYRKKR